MSSRSKSNDSKQNGSSRCNEQDTLRVMEQFKEFYEEKLNEVDSKGGGDCLEMKLKIQRRWIDDLTEQTQMMARIVKELEDEATTRVRMLEDKLRQTSKSAYEVMKRYQTYSINHNLDENFQKVFYLENDLKNLLEFVRRARDDKKWSIDGLQFYDVTYKDLFGRDQCPDASNEHDEKGAFAEKSSSQSDDCVSSNPTYDQISQQLKRKTEELGELRRSMLDMRNALTEEVACKHDIISALKKDIQQLEERCVQSDKQTAFKDDIIKELRKETKQLRQQNQEKEAELKKQVEELKSAMKRMKPPVDVTTTYTHTDEPDYLIQRNKDDIIQIQNDTLNVIDVELQAARRRDRDLEEEIGSRQKEVEELKCRCAELEAVLADSQGRADNLQKAVDLYMNSVNVLEAAEEKARIEIEQQKTTIANLQEALVSVKQEVDELKQSAQQEVLAFRRLNDILYVNLVDLEERNETLLVSYKKLQDCTLELEMEHFDALQDLDILETRLFKYQSESRRTEESRTISKSEVKKLRKQNRCYEKMVECFKHEMAVMSEQLVHLQEILSLSNRSCREESSQLSSAIVELQRRSAKLQAELVANEKKMLLENQKNQLKDAQIGELQLVIDQKNADLNVHDEAINEMKTRFEHCLLENHQLQNTVMALNSRVMQLQVHLQNKRSVTEGDTRGVEHAEMLQQELERMKVKNKEKLRALKRQNDELTEKLERSERECQRLKEEAARIAEETSQMEDRDCCREHELTQCKQIVIELRQALIELNENMSTTELSPLLELEESYRKTNQDQEEEDLFMSCRCEIALYKKLAENYKNTLLDLSRRLKEAEAQTASLSEDNKLKELKLQELQRKTLKKDKEHAQTVQALTNKLKQSQEEEKRLSLFIEKLKLEVQKKLEEKKEREHVISICQCVNADDTQEELASLKDEIKNMIQNQLALNNENDKLLRQVSHFQNNVTQLEEKNRVLKQKLDKCQTENQTLKDRSRLLVRETETLTHAVKNLEAELAETRNCRDDLCAESRNVINNVKAWLEEQKKINDKVKLKTQGYCNTIAMLQQENEELISGRVLAQSTPYRHAPKLAKTCPPVNDCPCLWSLGSQGNDSSRDSPGSCACSMEEWYSPNYKDDEETTDDYDDAFLNTLEAITHEIRSNNKKWKQKCQECCVTKDDK